MRRKIVALGLAIIMLVGLLPGEFVRPVTAVVEDEPVLSLSVDKNKESENNILKTSADAIEINLGDYISWGIYNGNPILWRAVAKDEYGTLMLADEVLTWRAFNSSGLKSANKSVPDGYNLPAEPDVNGRHRLNRGSNLWISSSIRAWLNSNAPAGQVEWVGNPPSSNNVASSVDAYDKDAGFLTSFSEFELSHIKTVTMKNILNELDIGLRNLTSADGTLTGGGTRLHTVSNNANGDIVQNYDTDAYYMMVTDRVFLLDVKQLAAVLANSNAYGWRTEIDPTVSYHQGVWNNQIVEYWLRSPIPGSNLPAQPRRTVRSFNGLGNTNAYESQGIRPAFYIDTEGLSLSGGTGDKENPLEFTNFGIKLTGDNRTKKYTPETDLLRVTADTGGASNVTVQYVLVDPDNSAHIDSEEKFNALIGDKGTLSYQGAGYNLYVGKNCKIWIMAKGKQGTKDVYAFASYDYRNFYEPVEIRQSGIINNTANEYLYRNMTISGKYGIPINSYKNSLLSGATYEKVMFAPTPQEYSIYWSRVSASADSITLNNYAYYTAHISGNPHTVTLAYEKNPSEWYDVHFEFLDFNSKNHIDVEGILASEQPFTYTQLIPSGKKLSDIDIIFDLPNAVDTNLSPYQYEIYNESGTKTEEAIYLDSGADFDPIIKGNNYTVKVYYKAEQVKITERYLLDGIGNTFLRPDHVVWIASGTTYNRAAAQKINGYVCVAYQVQGENRINFPIGTTGTIVAGNVTSEKNIIYFYKTDSNGNGVPDESECKVTVNWSGDYLNGDTKVIQDSKTEIVLKGNPVIVTNTKDYNAGDKNHIIIDSDNGKWIFDKSRTPETVIIESINQDKTITFHYNYDSKGNGIADVDQYVTEKYVIYDGVSYKPLPNFSDTYTNVLKGDKYSKYAPTTGYMAYGYKIDDGELVKFPDGKRTVTIDATTKINHTVTFVYRQPAAPVTVKWIGITENNFEVIFGSLTLNGYVGQQFNIHHIYDSPFTLDEENWEFGGSVDNYTIILSNEPQYFTFNYTEKYDEDFIITVIGESSDGEVDYSYDIVTTLNAEKFDVIPRNIQGYTVTAVTALDIYGDNFGTDDKLLEELEATGKINIDPSKGKGYLIFTYEYYLADIEVRATEKGNPDNILSTRTYSNMKIGETFSVNAPYIEGWILDNDESVIKTTTVKQNGNIITFEYVRPSSVFIHCIEEADGNEVVLRTVSVTQAGNVYPPDLREDYFHFDISNKNNDPNPTNVVDSDFTNGRIIKYYYVSEMMDVVITAVDESGNVIGTPVTLSQAARKGEMYTATAPAVTEGYVLNEPSTKQVYANPRLPFVFVTFTYHKLQDGEVTVRHFYMDDDANKIILREYTVQQTVGSQFTASAGGFTGFELKNGETSKIVTVDSDPMKNIIEFEYTDIRKKVTVNINKNGTVDSSLTQTFRVSDGTENFIIYPSYVSGYSLAGYQINDGTEITDSLTAINIGTVNDNMSVTLNYVSYINITVVCKTNDTNGNILHSFVIKKVRYSDIDVTIINVDTDLPKFELWELQSGQTGKGTVTPNKDQTIEFYYKTKQITVTVNAVDKNSNTFIPNFIPLEVTAIKGETFSYNAPYIEGWALAENEPMIKTIIVAEDNKVITFEYVRPSSVFIHCIEEVDGNEVILRTISVNTIGNVFAPDLRDEYFIFDASNEKNDPNPTNVTNADFTNKKIIKYYYVSEMMDVVITAVDESGNVIGDTPKTLNQAARKGEMYTATAPVIDGYVLNEPSTKQVYANPRLPLVPVTFTYYKLQNAEITVRHFYMNGSHKTILKQSTVQQTEGSQFTAHSEYFAGFELKDSETSKTVTVNSDPMKNIIEFEYTDIRITVTVNISKNGTVDNSLTQTFRVIAGTESYTVHPPYISGYSIAGYQINGGTEISDNLTAVNIGTVNSNIIVTLNYVSYVNVTVIGKENDTGGNELFKFVIKTQYSKNSVTLIDISTLPKFSSLELKSEQNEKGTLIPDNDKTVEFYYETKPDNKITICHFYTDGSKNKTVLSEYSMSQTIGSIFTASSRSFVGFELKYGEPSSKSIKVHEDETENIIEFEYTDIRKTVKVNISKNGTVDNTLTQTFRVIAGTKNYIVSVPDIESYLFTGYQINNGKFQKEANLDDIDIGTINNDITVTLNYVNHVNITVTGKENNTNGNVLFVFSINTPYSEIFNELIDITNDLPKFELWKLQSGQENKGTVMPNKDQTVEFYYETKQTTVTIKAVVDSNDTLVPGFIPIEVTAIKGEAFSYNAPYIEGWALADGEKIIKTLTVKEINNIITFKYVRPSSVFIHCIEEVGGNEVVLRTVSVTQAGSVSAPDLKDEYFIFDESNAKNDPNPTNVTNADFTNGRIIKYYYVSEMMDVVITAVDESGNAIGTPETLNQAARKGEMYTATAPVIDGYVLNEPSTKQVHADPNDNFVSVTFTYHKLQDGEVTIRHFYMNGLNKTILNQYTIQQTAGSEFTAHSENFAGFKLESGASDSKTITVNADHTQNVIEFEYKDIRKTVTVKIIKNGEADNTLTQTFKVPHGTTNYIVYPPYISGYSLAGYQINDGTEITDGLTAINIGTVNDNVSVTLNYVSYVNITVVCKTNDTNGNILHSFVIKKVRYSDSDVHIINVDTDLPKFELWKLQSGQENKGTVTPNKDQTVEFYYETKQTTVTIKAVVDSNGTLVPGFTPIEVTAIKGETFSYNAPYIEGWALAENEPIIKTIIVAEDNKVITFKYVRPSSVFIHCIEEVGGNEVVLRTVSVTQAGSVSAPDLKDEYFIFDESNAKNAPNPTNVTNSDFTNGKIIKYYYVSEMMDVKITSVDENGNTISSVTLSEAARKGEMYTATAPIINGYVPNEPSTKQVHADPSYTLVSVTFTYHKLQDGEVTIRHFYMNGLNKTILKQYTVQQTAGSEFTAHSENFAGFELSEGISNSKTVIVNVNPVQNVIEFEYKDIRKTVTVKIIKNGEADNTLTQTFKVPRGTTSYIVYPPYISGHSLAGYQIDNNAKVTGSYTTVNTGTINNDVTVTLYYEQNQSVVAVTIKAIVSGEGTPVPGFTPIEVTAIKGGTFSYNAPYIEGWTLADREQSTKTITVQENNNVITFEYVRALSVVTIRHFCMDGSNKIILKEQAVQQTAGSEFTAYAESFTGFELNEGTSNSKTVTVNVNSVQNVIEFEYKDIRKTVTVKIEKNGEADNTLTQTFKVPHGTTGYIVYPPYISGYSLAGYQINGGAEVTGSYTTVDIGTIDSDVTVTLYYEQNQSVVAVTVKAIVSDEGTPVPGFTQIEVTAIKGGTFSYNAPYIEGWALADGEQLIKTITVQENNNVITFEYVRPSSVAIHCIEEVGGNEVILRTVSVTQTGDVYPPDLKDEYFIFDKSNAKNAPNPTNVTNADFTNGKIIKYYYVSEMMDVVITAVDEIGNVIGTPEKLNQAARKGEMYTATAPVIDGYALNEPSTKQVHADPSYTLVSVTFTYHKLQNAEVTIRHFYMNGLNKTILKQYTVQQTAGSEFTAHSENFAGFELKGNETSKTITVNVNPVQNVIEFEYKDIRKTVTVKIIKNGEADDTLTQTFKVPHGTTSYIVYPPYISGYSLAGYQINNNAKVTGSSTAINIGTINSDVTVTLYYEQNQSLADVTVKAIVSGEGTPVPGFTPVEVTAIKGGTFSYTAPYIEGWTLADGEQSTKTITVEENNNVITFEYVRTLSIITIHHFYMDSSNKIILKEQTVQQTAGSEFTAYSENFEGFELKDGTSNSKTVTVNANPAQNVIEFEYKDIRKTVTVKIEKNGEADNTLTQTFKVPHGTTNYIVYPPYISGHSLAGYQINGGAEVTGSYTTVDIGTIDSDVTVTLYYASHVNVTVVCKENDTNGNILSSFVIKGIRYGNNPVNIINVDTDLPKFELWKLQIGQEGKGIVIPNTDQTIEFYYETKQTTVIVRAIVSGEGTPVPDFTPIEVTAIKGEIFSYNAPYIEGWALADEENLIKSITVQGNDNIITFEYVRPSSVVIQCIEETDDREIILRIISVNQSGDVYPPDLKDEYFIFDESNAKNDPNPTNISDSDFTNGRIIRYYYVSEMIDVVITAVDENGDTISATTLSEAARKGEMYTATAPDIDGYILDESPIKQVYANPELYYVPVTFSYHRLKDVKITIRHFYMEGSNEVVLAEYTVYKTERSEFTAYSESFTGFELKDNASVSKTVIVNANPIQNVIEFEYKDIRKTVTVKIEKNGKADDTLTQIFKVPHGTTNYIVHPPYISGYSLAEYKIGESIRSADALTDIDIETIDSDITVILNYVSISLFEITIRHFRTEEDSSKVVLAEYIVYKTEGTEFTAYSESFTGFKLKDNVSVSKTIIVNADPMQNIIEFEYVPVHDVSYVDITVVCKENDTDGNVLDIYVINVQYSNNPVNIINVYTDLPKFELWKLQNGQEGKGTIIPNTDQTIEFYYETKQAIVTVKAVISDSDTPVPNFIPVEVTAIKGEPFTYNAPYIPGYKLADGQPSTQSIDSVKDGDILIFVYIKISGGNVTVILREEINGNIIGTESYTLANGERRKIPVPNLQSWYYTALSTAKTVTYTGTPLVVEYYYEKDTIEVVKKTYDINDAGNPNAQPIQQFSMGMYRIGEIAKFYAPSKEMHELSDDPLKLIRISPPPAVSRAIIYQEVAFYYAPITSGKLVVEAVNENGEILYTYHKTAPDGTDMEIFAPSVAGYQLKTGEPESKTGTVPGKVQFVYTEIKKTADLTVSVTFAQSGEAFKGVKVTVNPDDDLKIYTTDDAGNIVLRNLPYGDYTVTAKYTGYNNETVSFTLDGNKTVYLALIKTESENNGGNGNNGNSGNGGNNGDNGNGNNGNSETNGENENNGNHENNGNGNNNNNSGGESVPSTSDKNLNEITTITPDDSGLLEKNNHISYIHGYSDGTIRPDAFITRAETAVIFYRLLKNQDGANIVKGGFVDIEENAWYTEAISILNGLGILKGYADGTFKPNNMLTRAEFAAIASRFDVLEKFTSKEFSDVDSKHWAFSYISSAYEKGWVSGYPTGAFKPDNPITRAEVVTIINRMLNRKVKAKNISDNLNVFSDLSKKHWAYADLMEAAIRHKYQRDKDGYEVWQITEEN